MSRGPASIFLDGRGTPWLTSEIGAFVLLHAFSGRLSSRECPSLRRVNPQVREDDETVPAEEVLAFDVPAKPALREFDDMTIRFRMSYLHAHANARIAIKRFVFVPR